MAAAAGNGGGPAAAAALPAGLEAELRALFGLYPEPRAALIPMLHRCQEELGGWLSPDTLEACAGLVDMEPVEVFGVASFYPMFHLRPRGEHVVSVCHNISCDLRGARDVLARVCAVTGAEPGATSPDGRFTVLTVECQGACTNAPMLDLDGVYHESLAPSDVERILAGVSEAGSEPSEVPPAAPSTPATTRKRRRKR